MIHNLKTWPKFFNETVADYKQFEIRNNDRDFKEFDELVLEEWDPEKSRYTGRMVKVLVQDIWRDLPGLQEGYVLMSVRKIGERLW